MSRKWLVIFTLLSASVAAAKDFTVSISRAFQVGTTPLKAGEYRLKLEGTKVTLIDKKNHPAAEAEVTVEQTEKKTPQTTVFTHVENGVNQIQSIDLGGSTTRLVFK